jgi:hypothetical protein
VTDDGPALQSALDALANAGGGTLIVPDGRYAIATAVSEDFSGQAAVVSIQGAPSAAPDNGTGDYGRGLNLTAEFLIKTGETRDAINLQNLTTLAVTNLVFSGDPLVQIDARIVLRLSGITSTTINYCEFYGLSSLVTDGAIVHEVGGELKITDSAFLGCAGNSGTYTAIVQVYGWTGLSITGTRFVDYGNRPGFYSKTTIMSPFSWVSIGGAAPLTNLSPRRDVVISNVLFDEGAYYALSVRPDLFPVANGGPISLVYLSNLYVNVTNLGEVGLRIHNADNVFIENSHFGWSHNSRGAMELADVKNALLNRIECVLSASTIIADDTVNELSVVNSAYETLDSHAPVTRVINTADPADGPARYVNQQYFDVLGQSPDIPGYVYWSEQLARCDAGAPCPSNAKLLTYLNAHPAPTFSITGQLLDPDGAPMPAATVSIGGTHQLNTATDAEGKYVFSGLASGGEYTITPTKTYYTFLNGDGTSSQTFITPIGDQTADFTGSLAHFAIKGRVNDVNQQAMSGVNLTLSGGPAGFAPQSQITNGAGDYSFVDLPAGFNYSVTAAKDFYTFAPPVQSILLAGDTPNLDFAGTPETHSISGQITDGNAPLAGANVTLTGDASRSTTSDSSGSYNFDGLVAGGTYVVLATKRHYTFTSQTIPNLVSDCATNFAGDIIRYTITVSVTDGTNGVGGTTLILAGDHAETVMTSGGTYTFTVDAGGSYTLTAAKEGYCMAPATVAFNDLDQNVYPSFVATAVPTLLTVGGTDRAVAFNSISMLAEPFDLFTTPFDFSPDRRTRLVLFALNVPNDPSEITAQAEDSLGNVYFLNIEFDGALEGTAYRQINLRLSSQLATGADLRVSITVNGVTTNTVLIGIN